MQSFSVFDIIGPRMVGPSSSHTAGAARLGMVANKLVQGDAASAHITLYGSFAKTGRGHGTDKAIIAGLLGMKPDDPNLRFSQRLAQEANKNFEVEFSNDEMGHPNTAKIQVQRSDGKKYILVGSSIGGGNIVINEINGMPVDFNCQYPTTLVFHYDEPGVTAKVTGVLARQGINIAFMKLFRSAKRMDACMILETDSTVPPQAREEIMTCHEGIMEVCAL